MRSNDGTRRLGAAILLTAVSAAAPSPARAQTSDADWPMYSLDLGGSRFSPLADITPRNVGRLAEAWAAPVARALEDDSEAPGGRGNPQATPIVVDGVLYLPARGNEVVALEAHTGGEIWRHTLRPPLSTTARGVAYWPGDGTLAPRILLTAGPTLVALDARNGRTAQGFGTDGVVQIGRASCRER